MTHSTYELQYFGIFIMLVMSFLIFGAIVKLSSYIGSKLANKNDERLKSAVYENGPESIKQPIRINSHFFLIGVLFLLFDLEIIFMFPWAINFKILGIFGLIEMFLFIIILTIGFIYAWSKGALKWQTIR